jgi:superfamily I DNA and/or RNA helicase
MDYFKKLQDLLLIEKTDDKNEYKKLTEHTSIHERRLNGICWYPIVIKDTELTQADYVVVEMERVSFKEINHQLRHGMHAELFSNVDAQQYRIQGTVTHQNRDTIKIKFKTDELPEWTREGKLGIDCLFDENSYNEMYEAIKQAEKKYNENETDLIKILVNERQITYNDTLEISTSEKLNVYQQNAVKKIVQAKELSIVHGPPGTGKTTTLVEAIKQMIKAGYKKILVTAPSNTAVDLLCEKINDEKISVVRIGNPARVNDKIIQLTLDAKILDHKNVKEIKKLKKQAQEYKNMAHKYKRSFGKAERDQRRLLFEEAYKIMKSVEDTEKYITTDILNKSQVIGATLIGSNHYAIRNIQYDAVIIDEAGQALEPACWVPILKTKKLILAGDHCQLPPTIKSYEAAQKGLNNTLLEKNIIQHAEAVSLLNEQYRMNETIMNFSSVMFYEQKLKANEVNKNHTIYNLDIPVEYIDTAGCGFDEMQEGTTISNKEEAIILIKHLKKNIEKILEKNILPFPTIAVISPYKQQIIFLQESILGEEFFKKYLQYISINTIDSFQGQERDMVYISMVRCNSKNEIGFLKDTRRMNVAMTRARKKLVIIGDSATLSHFKFYDEFISYSQKVNGYSSAWEFVNE